MADQKLDKCKSLSLNHLRRIQGQLKTLEKYIENDVKTQDIAMLTTAIAKSFESLRTKNLEYFLLEKAIERNVLDEKFQIEIKEILKLYKK